MISNYTPTKTREIQWNILCGMPKNRQIHMLILDDFWHLELKWHKERNTWFIFTYHRVKECYVTSLVARPVWG